MRLARSKCQRVEDEDDDDEIVGEEDSDEENFQNQKKNAKGEDRKQAAKTPHGAAGQGNWAVPAVSYNLICASDSRIKIY